jgi:hypothetical protein
LFFAADLILKVDVEQKQIPSRDSTRIATKPDSMDIAFATAEQSSFQSNFEDVEQSQLDQLARRQHLS